MADKIKTGNKTLADHLLEGGVKGRKFLQREVGREGAVYEVLKIFPERTPAVYDGIRNKIINVGATLRYKGIDSSFQTRLAGYLEDLEVLE